MAAVLAIGLLAGCASIVEGTDQQIAVNFSPAGADCGLYRKGLKIGTIMQAPGSTLVNETKSDIWIVCIKPDYQPATYLNHSGIAGGKFGNIVAGSGIGWAINSASGADNKYDGTVDLTLAPATQPPAAPPALPATFEGTLPAS